MEWNPWFYDSAIAKGTAVCVEHRGRHQWVACGPLERDWFCLGEIVERMRERRSHLDQPTPHRDHDGLQLARRPQLGHRHGQPIPDLLGPNVEPFGDLRRRQPPGCELEDAFRRAIQDHHVATSGSRRRRECICSVSVAGRTGVSADNQCG